MSGVLTFGILLGLRVIEYFIYGVVGLILFPWMVKDWLTKKFHRR